MDAQTLLIYVIGPVIFTMGAYIVKTILGRVDALETKMENRVTETTVRQILSDKLDPIQEDLKEIKADLKKLFDQYARKQ